MTCATEYFISYYDCKLDHCDKATDPEHRCPKCPNDCPNWRLHYRCHIGNLTVQELKRFKQKCNIDQLPDYLLQDVNDLSLDSLEKREEHVQAREDFERLPEWGHQQPEIAASMRDIQFGAEVVRDMRYGTVPVPFFVDSEVANFFYKMEMSILESAIHSKIWTLNREEKKLCEGVLDVFDLTPENNERLAKIGKEKRE